MATSNVRGREVDMLHGSIFQKLCIIAIPIVLSSILQQLFNAADVMVLGQFSSSEAMAAVGSNAPVINVIVTLFTGLSVGANVLISGRIGADQKDRVSDALHTSIAVALVCGILTLVLGQFITEPALRLLGTPDNVLDQAALYLRIYFLGMPAIMIYNFGSAVLRAVGDTRRPLYCLILGGLLNVGLNVFFVLCLGRAADGVAIATVISNVVSAALVYIILRRETGMLHLDPARLRIGWDDLWRIIAVGGPAGLQGMLFSISNVVIQTAINRFGSACIAGNSAALNFEYISYFVVNGFAQATVTFISQNYAAGNNSRCRQTTRIAYLCSIVFCACVSVPCYLLRYPLLGLFTADSEVLFYGLIRMAWITALEPITTAYEIPAASLRGIGHSLSPAIIILLGCCVVRLVYVALFLSQLTDFTQVTRIYPATWIITAVPMTILYFSVTRKAYHRA